MYGQVDPYLHVFTVNVPQAALETAVLEPSVCPVCFFFVFFSFFFFNVCFYPVILDFIYLVLKSLFIRCVLLSNVSRLVLALFNQSCCKCVDITSQFDSSFLTLSQFVVFVFR